MSPEEYGKSVDLAKEFLRGDSQKVQEDLTRRMNEYSQKLDFERAAVMRDHLAAISNVIHQQSMELRRMPMQTLLPRLPLKAKYV